MMNLQQVVFEFLSPDTASLPRDCVGGGEGGRRVKKEMACFSSWFNEKRKALEQNYPKKKNSEFD